MYCKKCGKEIKETAVFCPNCGTARQPGPVAGRVDRAGASGAATPRVCLACGVTLKEGKAFCHGCGQPWREHGEAVLAPALPRTPQFRCEACGAALKAGKSFCAACGNPISKATPPESALAASYPGIARDEAFVAAKGPKDSAPPSRREFFQATSEIPAEKAPSPIPKPSPSRDRAPASAPAPVLQKNPPEASQATIETGPAQTSQHTGAPTGRRKNVAMFAVLAVGGVLVLAGLGALAWWLLGRTDGVAVVVPVIVPDENQFVGVWQNDDKLADGITQIIIRPEKNGLSFAMKDKAYPDDKERGATTGTVSAKDGTVALQWSLPYSSDSQVLKLLPDGRLQVSGKVRCTGVSHCKEGNYDDYFVLSSKTLPPLTPAITPPPSVDKTIEVDKPGPTIPSHTAGAIKPKIRLGDFVEASALDQPPVLLEQPALVYTQEAVKNQTKGTVVFQASVDQDGKVTAAKVVSGPQPDFGMDDACVQALLGAKFSVPTKGGIPVSTNLKYVIILNPPPKPVEQGSVSLIIESKAHVQRFAVEIDGQAVFDGPMVGSMANDIKVTRQVNVLPGTHHFAASATFASGRTIQAQWDQPFEPGQQCVFNVWVPTFGASIKMKRLQ